MNKTGLGRGLSSLIATNVATKSPADKSLEILLISVNKITANRYQPRKSIDAESVKELAASIKVHGILQPIVVTAGEGDTYELISGHRRLEASKIAGLNVVPAIVRSADNLLKLELAIIENVQRENLNAIEEASAYQRLVEEFDLTQEEISKKTGKSRAAVSNALRLLSLPLEIQKGVIEGKISAGHARAILAITNPEKQRALYGLIIKNAFSVRQAEEKVREIQVKSHTRQINSANAGADEFITGIKKTLEEALGTRVGITSINGKSGKITIDFYSKEELSSIVDKVNRRV